MAEQVTSIDGGVPMHGSATPPGLHARVGAGRAGTLRFDQEIIVLALAVLLFLAFSALLPGFFTVGNLMNLVQNVSVLGILGVGMAVVIIGRGIDLAMVSNMAISIAWAAKLMEGGASTTGGLMCGLGFALLVAAVTA